MTADVLLRTRTALCDMLDSLSDAQWSAETLCDGWDAGDMTNHLIARERGTISSLGILLPALEALHERKMQRVGTASRAQRVQRLRSGPPPWLRIGPGAGVQVGEDWIHMQDIVRGGASTAEGVALSPDDGTADPEVGPLLWKAIGRFVPLTLGRSEVDGVIALTDGTRTRTYRMGGTIARPAPDARPDVTVTGPVGELVLWVTGRDAARVEVTGDGPLRTHLAEGGRGV